MDEDREPSQEAQSKKRVRLQRPSSAKPLHWLDFEERGRNAELYATRITVRKEGADLQQLTTEDGEDGLGEEEIFEYQGKRIIKGKPPTEPWYKEYLEAKRTVSQQFIPEEEEPFHFQTEEPTTDDIELLKRQRLFTDPNDIEALSSSFAAVDMNSAVEPEDDISANLYADLEELEEEGAETDSLSWRSVKPEGVASFDYRRFYNYNHDVLYDPDLSVTHSHEAVMKSIAENRVTIIVGPTGTGKTTHIPLFILDGCAKDAAKCSMVVTQPRRLAAVTNARRVASLRKDCKGRPWKIGHLVGFHVGMSRTATRVTCLTFCTTAIFLKIAASELNLNRFTHIFLDEVHERDQDTDVSLMLVKKMMQENSLNVKLIIMSATMNLEKIRAYFEEAHASLTPNVVNLSHSYSHNIRQLFLDEIWHNPKKWPEFSVNDPQLHRTVLDETVQLISRLPDQVTSNGHGSMRNGHREKMADLGAVLVFLPGWSDIEDLERELSAESAKQGYNWEILKLHSQLSSEFQNEVMSFPRPDVRRIILATNIAESSITIPYVVYVIDFGLTKRLIVDESLDIPRLAVQWTSKANMMQRRGRTGRVQRGVYYCMLPAAFHQELLDHEMPDITISPIHHSILHVKVLNLPRTWKPHNLFSLLLDPPPKKKVDVGILQLKEAGALSLKMDGRICLDNGELTHIGRILESLPISPNLGRLLIFAYVFGVLGEGMKLAAGLSLHSIFLTSPDSKKALHDWFDKQVRYDVDSGSDCMCMLKALEAANMAMTTGVLDHVSWEQWCIDNLISPARLRELEYLRMELQMRLTNMGMYNPEQDQQLSDSKSKDDILRVVLAAAFYPNYFVQEALDSQQVAKSIPYGDPQLSLEFTHLPGGEGPLYEEQLRWVVDPFRMLGGIPPQIIYTTDTITDRAYMTFSRHTLSCAYGVARGVHLALRATRGFRDKPTIGTVPATADYRRQINKYITDLKNSLVLDSLFLARKDPRGPKPIIPPATAAPTGLDKIFVEVVNIQAADRLFIRFLVRAPAFAALHKSLQSLKENDKAPPAMPVIQPGDYALALVERTVYRVQIVSLYGMNGECVKIFAVDTGEYFDVGKNFIRQIPAQYGAEPSHAFEFRFVGIHIREFLAEEVLTFLNSGILVPERTTELVRLEVYSLVGSVVHGTLFINHVATGCTEINLNEELVMLGFACRAKESYLSQTSHLNPEGHLQYGPTLRFVDVPLSRPPNINTPRTQLHGPFCPIVGQFKSLVQQLVSCEVRCSVDSVNHRVLDGRPEMGETAQRMMVAGSLERSQKSEGTVVLRNSTLMPRQPGLLAVLVTLFAPCIQLKTDKKISKKGYIGAIAGVGFAPSRDGKKALSLYPDHDMRAQFDVVLSRADVDAINDLRIMINHVVKDIPLRKTALSEERKTAVSSLKTLQRSCQKNLIDILTVSRKPCPDFSKRQYATNFVWSLKDKPLQELTKSDPMLQPLYLANLEGVEDLIAKDRLRDQNLELHRQAVLPYTESESSRRSQLSDRGTFECGLCRKLMGVRQEISVHIHSDTHKKREREELTE